MHTAMRQAAERDHSLQSEVRILLVHGLLHLLGYDHETSDKDMEVVRFGAILVCWSPMCLALSACLTISLAVHLSSL